MDYEAFYRDLRKPDFVPGYEILHKIGGGVFGEVFKARKKSIGRVYAIKFLKIGSDAQRAIIEKELESLTSFAQIDHPNLVGIEDRGAVHGIPFIIMTFAGDRTLADRLAEGPLGPVEQVEVFEQILAGVAALHQRSIVHFDLKPANVFIRDRTVRVGDYGLAKMLSESRQSLSFGRGTPYYMAPEVMRRKGDLRSDVYSLGAMLYELVTGKVPFDGDTDWEVLKKHEVEPVRFPPDFSPALKAIVATAMHKDPAARYGSAEAMRVAFRQATGGRTAVEPLPPDAELPAVPLPAVPLPAAPLPSTVAEAVPHPMAKRINAMAQRASRCLREGPAHPAPGAGWPLAPAAPPAASPAPSPHETAAARPAPRHGHRIVLWVFLLLIGLGLLALMGASLLFVGTARVPSASGPIAVPSEERPPASRPGRPPVKAPASAPASEER